MAYRLYPNTWARLMANSVVDERTGCWVWTGHSHRGYPLITLRMPHKPHPVKIRAHRLALELYHGYEFPFDEAQHDCCNTLCIRPGDGHGRIVTQAENLSLRRGYAHVTTKRPWIPVLFPTSERERNEALDALIDIHNSTPGFVSEVCPF